MVDGTAARAFNTRPWFIAVAATVFAAWAAVGLATGHIHLLVGRGIVHFQGGAALALSLSAACAGAAFVSMLSARKSRATPWLIGACLALTLIAIVLKHAASTSPLTSSMSGGLVPAHKLRQWLNQPQIAVWARAVEPAVVTWLKASCFGLLAVALLLALVGATKASAERSPRVTTTASIVFGTPFLAWFTVSLLDYAFSSIPAAASGDGFAAKASFALSVLIVVFSMWWLAGVASFVLLLQMFGGRVRWVKRIA